MNSSEQNNLNGLNSNPRVEPILSNVGVTSNIPNMNPVPNVTGINEVPVAPSVVSSPIQNPVPNLTGINEVPVAPSVVSSSIQNPVPNVTGINEVPVAPSVVSSPIPNTIGVSEIPYVAQVNSMPSMIETPIASTPNNLGGFNQPVITNEVNNVINPSQVMPNNLDNNVMDPNEVSSNGNEPKKNKTIKIIIAIVAVLIVILIGAFVWYKVYFSNPYNLYKTAVSEGFAFSIDFLEEIDEEMIDFDLANDNLITDGNISFKSNTEGLEELNNYSLDYYFGVDLKNENIVTSYQASKDNTEFLSILAELANNVLYLESDALFDKTIMINDSGYNLSDYDLDSLTETVTIESEIYLLEKLSIYVVESLDKDAFSSESSTLTINGKSENVTSNIYTIDSNAAKSMTKSILENIKNDVEFLTILSEISGTDVNTIKDGINDYIELIETSEEVSEETITFTLYTKGFLNKTVGVEIKHNDEIVLLGTYLDDELNIDIESLGTVNADTTDDKIIINILLDDVEYDKLEISYEEKSEDAHYLEVNFVVDSLNSLKVAFDYSSTKTSNSVSSNYDFSFTYISDVSLDINLSGNNTLTVNGTMDGAGKSFATDVNDLTDADYEVILKNFETSIKGTIFETYVEDYMNSISEEVINNTNCALAFNCTEYGDQLYCYYYDDEYNLNSVICENPEYNIYDDYDYKY